MAAALGNVLLRDPRFERFRSVARLTGPGGSEVIMPLLFGLGARKKLSHFMRGASTN